MPSKTILVTGGAGFIGSHIVKKLQEEGYRPIVLDNLSRGNPQTLKEVLLIKGDCGDKKLLAQLFNDHSIEAVIHCAAYIDVGESMKNPSLYYSNNVLQTLNLLEGMIRQGVKKIIFSSSAAVYGQPLVSCINESHPCSPINPYGKSKWMIEKILEDFDLAHHLKYCSLRYFNAAGGHPEKRVLIHQPHVTNLIPLILRNLRANQPTTIFGTDYPTPDGTCIRDYVHIEDLSRAHLLAMEKLFDGAPSTFYNLGNGEGYSVRAVIKTVEKVIGRSVPLKEGSRRIGDPAILVADAHKAKKELGWTPHYSDLESMILHAWNASEDVQSHE